MSVDEALEIPGFLDRRPTKPLVWTFTLLNCYREICPHQAAERFIYRRIPFVETDAMRWGNQVHVALEKRVGRGTPLPREMPYENIAAAFDGRDARVERRLGITRQGRACDFFGADVWGRGKLDLHLVNGERALLFDYKTGREREDPFELHVQAVLLHAKYPQLKEIKGKYFWLKESKSGKLHDLSDTTATWNEIGRLVRLIERDMAAGSFEKREGPLCNWCECLSCENNPRRA